MERPQQVNLRACVLLSSRQTHINPLGGMIYLPSVLHFTLDSGWDFFPLKRPFPLRPSFRVSRVTQNKTKEEQSEDIRTFGGAMRKMRVVSSSGWEGGGCIFCIP